MKPSSESYVFFFWIRKGVVTFGRPCVANLLYDIFELLVISTSWQRWQLLQVSSKHEVKIHVSGVIFIRGRIIIFFTHVWLILCQSRNENQMNGMKLSPSCLAPVCYLSNDNCWMAIAGCSKWRLDNGSRCVQLLMLFSWLCASPHDSQLCNPHRWV